MSYCDIEDIVRSLEFPIGTKFYFKNTLLEVTELEDDGWGCSQCVFAGEEDLCGVMNCHNCRHDKKFIFLRKWERQRKRGSVEYVQIHSW